MEMPVDKNAEAKQAAKTTAGLVLSAFGSGITGLINLVMAVSIVVLVVSKFKAAHRAFVQWKTIVNRQLIPIKNASDNAKVEEQQTANENEVEKAILAQQMLDVEKAVEDKLKEAK